MSDKKPTGERMRDLKVMVCWPPDKLRELKDVAKSQGLPMAAFIRNAAYMRIAELKKAA